MIPLTVLAAIVIAPVLLALLFRVNALYIFLSVCAGYFLQSALSDDIDLALATIIQGSNSVVAARLSLLFIPVLLTIFILKKTQGKSVLLQIVPLVLSTLLLGTLSLPLLPPGMDTQIYSTEYGSTIRSSGDLIIATAVVSNLALLYTLKRKKEKHSKHH